MASQDQAPEKKRRARPADADRRRHTINDVARMAGVSKKTVSRVINESPFVKEETRKAVLEIIRDTGYAPDPQARGLAFRRSFLVGLIYDNPNPQHTVSHQQGILEALKGSGFELVVRPIDRTSPDRLAAMRARADLAEAQLAVSVISASVMASTLAVISREAMTSQGWAGTVPLFSMSTL